MLSVWLLSIALAFGLVLGQFAEAGTFAEHHKDASMVELSASIAQDGREAAPAPECHPGIACAAFVVPAGPSPLRSDTIVRILRPDATQSQRRFGGPMVTLPPPRNLI
jgi:hypothetical protein